MNLYVHFAFDILFLPTLLTLSVQGLILVEDIMLIQLHTRTKRTMASHSFPLESIPGLQISELLISPLLNTRSQTLEEKF